MNIRELETLSTEYAATFAERDPDGSPRRIGDWLVNTIGIGPVCVALGYRDGHFTRRFLDHVDARSFSDTMKWSERYRRAWLRLNVPSARSLLYERREERPESQLSEVHWRTSIEPSLGEKVSHWGPGRPVRSGRLERLRLLYLTASIVDSSRTSLGVFSYLLSTRAALATSPLLAISAEGVAGAESVLADAFSFAMEMDSGSEQRG